MRSLSNPRLAFPVGAVILLGLTAAMFGDVLFAKGDIVLSWRGEDLASYGLRVAAFARHELRQGNLPLWNPHIYSGQPFLGSFQPALLYPPNLLILILPLSKAVNLLILLHVLMAGLFMYLWALQRGLHPAASLLSGILLMFCGASFTHIYAGHVTIMYAAAWAPLLLLSVDGLLRTPSVRWTLVGMLAVAMQILAGHPQTAFYTAVCAVVYMGIGLIGSKHRLRAAAGLLGMYAGGLALGAAQLLPGLQASLESSRSGPMPYAIVASYSLPPENFLTFLSPTLLGDMSRVTYWGRFYLWETSLFLGVTGLFLAVYGAIYGDRAMRRALIPMSLVLLVLALGGYTPLLKLLYNWAPGFDRFRCSARFGFQASLFLVMLAGLGFDALLRRRHPGSKAVIGALASGALVAGLSLYVRYIAAAPDGIFARTMTAVRDSGETWCPSKLYSDPRFVQQAGQLASRSLLIAAATLGLVALILYLGRLSRKAVYALLLLAVIEVFAFARVFRLTFDAKTTDIPELSAFLREHKGDYRIFNAPDPNISMATGALDIWGYDPYMLRRYAEFIGVTQGRSPEYGVGLPKLKSFHPLYTMLRCRFAFIPEGDRVRALRIVGTMPHLYLVRNYVVVKERDKILRRMLSRAFDPRRLVILETEPDPRPVPGAGGSARIIRSSTDDMVIEADLPDPAILLITDAYSTGWRARSLPGSAQKAYSILPANYVLRAVPLSAGHHRILMEYMPSGFVIGKWVSIVSVAVYLIAALFCVRAKQ